MSPFVNRTIGQTATLFEEDTPLAPAQPGLAPAAARLITTRSPDMHDPEQRPLLLLVVDCPFCDHKHIHPAGHPDKPHLCLLRSRCVGTPGGTYFFPKVVHQ